MKTLKTHDGKCLVAMADVTGQPPRLLLARERIGLLETPLEESKEIDLADFIARANALGQEIKSQLVAMDEEIDLVLTGLLAGENVFFLSLPGAAKTTLARMIAQGVDGNLEALVTNDLDSDLTTVVRRKCSRWSIETVFRDSQQFSGLGACQCRVDQAMVRHGAFALIAFVLLQRFRRHPEETMGEVKDRLQREMFTGGRQPPPRVKGRVPAV